ncbi:MAG: hypothetical protein J1E63_06895 [Muribaculaceae bacterium]|nr:hypothetical protein [Muribaculaceae bacterium]
MKLLVVLAIICAIVATGLLILTCFVSGGTLVYTSIAAGLALLAFILLLVGYTTKNKV